MKWRSQTTCYSIHLHDFTLIFSFHLIQRVFCWMYVNCACCGCKGMSHFVVKWIDKGIIDEMAQSNPGILFIFTISLWFFHSTHSTRICCVYQLYMLWLQADVSLCCWMNRWMHGCWNDAVKPRYSIHLHVFTLIFSFHPFNACFFVYVSCACCGCKGMSHFVVEWIDECIIDEMAQSNPGILFIFTISLWFFHSTHSTRICCVYQLYMLWLQADVSLCCWMHRWMHGCWNDAVKPRYSIHLHVFTLIFSFHPFNACLFVYVSCACCGCKGMSHFVVEWIDECIIDEMTQSNPGILFIFTISLWFFHSTHSTRICCVYQLYMLWLQADVSLCCWMHRWMHGCWNDAVKPRYSIHLHVFTLIFSFHPFNACFLCMWVVHVVVARGCLTLLLNE